MTGSSLDTPTDTWRRVPPDTLSHPPPSPARENGPGWINPIAEPDWDAALAASPEATIFQGSAWARVLHETYGYAPRFFVSRRPGSERLDALLPLMEVDSWLTGRRAVGLPFTDECAPFGENPVAVRHLFQAAIDFGTVRKWKYLELRGGRTFFREAAPSTSFWGHRLTLDGGESALFARVNSSVRRAVRKAEQAGLSLETSQDLSALRAFYGLLCRTRQRHGVPPQPWRFFAKIHEHLLARDLAWVVLARKESTPVAGAVFFRSGKTALFKYGASDETHQQLRANNLVMWHAIRWLAEQGFATLDFGRTSLDNEGLRQFKLGWGTREHSIEYVRFSLQAKKFVTATDDSSGWHTHLFRRLPLPLARLAGRLLYRHVA